MPAYSRRSREVLEAVQAATRETARLNTAQGSRVDIFSIIEEAGIWLMFEQAQTLYGCYQRLGDTAGIMINANHPLNLQRSTAAHEYGHHVLGHASSFDEVDQIESGGPTIDPREVAAQTFAAHFLMPLKLVNATLLQMGLSITPPTMSPQQVYRFALELGVSYAAAVNHLLNAHKIVAPLAASLRKVEPRDIKALIGNGSRPTDGRADVWDVSLQDHGRVLYPRVNDEIHLALPEDASRNEAWTLVAPHTVDLRAVEPPIEPSIYDVDFGLIRERVEDGVPLSATSSNTSTLR